IIYQEFNLMPNLSVMENVFVGREFGRYGLIDRANLRRQTQVLLDRLGVRLSPDAVVRDLSVAEQQMVEIAKALSLEVRVFIMDEPTSALSDTEVQHLLAIMRDLKADGIGVIFISHRLEEIFTIGNRVTVMRDGEYIATKQVCDVTREDIIRMMVGRDLTQEFPKEVFSRGKERLRVEGLSRKGAFKDVSFRLHEGEIMGLTGLVGAGRTEVARAIFGADAIDAGTIALDGKAITVKSPQDAIRQGIGLLTEDRKHQGLILGMSVRENTTLANLRSLVKFLFVNRAKERQVTNDFVKELQIKTPHIEQTAQNLSGGNQQKVVLAKWLFTESKILIFDEPTRGIDVGAKVEIYKLMNELVRKGVCILMISSELPEVLGMCDRILVMHEGHIAGELSREDATQERVMQLATGQRFADVA
ncbi:MAG TPA: sugar ABC transporter ATP-binding protein, partial [Casimicrobium sp.]|nr:sugar ABC transporter ATP-binding protein [Casimicrobium sp.]